MAIMQMASHGAPQHGFGESVRLEESPCSFEYPGVQHFQKFRVAPELGGPIYINQSHLVSARDILEVEERHW